MKKLTFFFLLIISAGCINAQSYTPPATLPPFHILTTDSTYLTPANLKSNKPVVIIYFAPDCSHCQHMMYDFKPKMAAFKNVQVIMITFVQQLKAIQIFARDFDLKKYPSFVVGTEGYTYTVQKFYQVRTTPYVALYDKSHKLVKYFDKSPKAEDIIEAVKKL